MYLKSLRLINFRNYVRLDGSYKPGIIVLHGANAQGKTNFLEAIHYLSIANSSHARNNRQLIHFDTIDDLMPFARLDAMIQRAHDTREAALTIAIKKGRLQKRLELNGVKKKVQEYVGEINVVLFLPEDIDLIASGPSLRRRYLNTIISQIDKSYYRTLLEYDEILTQRNAHLKMLAERRIRTHLDDHLAFWDDKIVEAGAYIILRRQQTVARLDEIAGRVHSDLTGYSEFLRFAYQPRLDLGYYAAHQLSLNLSGHLIREGSVLTLPEVERRFRQALQNVRQEEFARGVTVIGPHRDDIRFLVNDVDMTLYGSRGQQRTSALTLRLSEMALIKEKRNDAPILLLDDVMSELDGHRRQYMLNLLANYPQVFMTTTDLSQFPKKFRVNSHLIQVEQGRHNVSVTKKA